MADVHETAAGEHAHPNEPTFGTYMLIFAALCVCTATTFLVNQIYGIGSWTGASLIMLVSILKATLVAMFFMHLKFDWFKLYFLIIPVMVLTVMMIVVLLPDIVLGWWHYSREYFGAMPR